MAPELGLESFLGSEELDPELEAVFHLAQFHVSALVCQTAQPNAFNHIWSPYEEDLVDHRFAEAAVFPEEVSFLNNVDQKHYNSTLITTRI